MNTKISSFGKGFVGYPEIELVNEGEVIDLEDGAVSGNIDPPSGCTFLRAIADSTFLAVTSVGELYRVDTVV